jgi:Nucleotidyl transferase AbiEii toxin, Type IV TA system
VLSPLQQRVARIVTALPVAEGFALAGGAALVLAEVVERETRDLDFFGPTNAQVEQLVPELETALRADGLDVMVTRAGHGFARLTIGGQDGSTTELDLGVDARIRPAETGPLGPMLALEELAADKMLALFGRAQARDFVDVAALVERFGLERLCQLASEKDPGFSRETLREMLGSFDRFSPADLGLDEAQRVRLAQSVRAWKDHLATGRRRPPPGTGTAPGL